MHCCFFVTQALGDPARMMLPLESTDEQVEAFRHADTYSLTQSGQRSSASSAIITSDHAGTHGDAICHQAEDNKLFGAIEVTSEIEIPEGFAQLGAETIPIIIGQGYLLDVAGYLGKKALPNSYAITTQDLRGCKEAQGVEIAPGGIILVLIRNHMSLDFSIIPKVTSLCSKSPGHVVI